MSTSFSKYADLGVLFIRLVIGGMFIFYGGPKLAAGPAQWQQLGQAMGNFHIQFWPVFWGFMASFSMAVGGLCIVLGLFTRAFSFLLLITMVVASSVHFSKGEGLAGAGHAIENGAVFLGLLFIGPGSYSLDAWLKSIWGLR